MLTDDDLPALWRELGIPGIVDVHTHFLPAPVMRAVWAYFDEAESNYGVPWPITYRWQDDARLALFQLRHRRRVFGRDRCAGADRLILI